MAWYLDSTRIFIQEFATNDKQIVARLQPLSGGTIHQIFGYESPVIKVKGYVVGYADRDDIRGMARDAGTHILYFGATPSWSDLIVSNVSANRLNWICQTIRPDLPTDTEVYDVELELYYDE